jgi:hypothetical protein
LNLGLCGVKTATNRLSHGIALPLLNMDYEWFLYYHLLSALFWWSQLTRYKI